MKETAVKSAPTIGVVLVGIVLSGCMEIHQEVHRYRNERVNEEVFGRKAVKPSYEVAGMVIDLRGKDDWTERKQSQHELLAGKSFRPLHTAVVGIVDLGPSRVAISTHEQFLAEAEKYIRAQKRGAPQQPKVTIGEGNGEWASCLSYAQIVEGGADPTAPDRPLRFEAAGYICEHPTRAKQFVMIDYSERYPVDMDVGPVRGRADEMFARIRFANPGVVTGGSA